MCSLNLRCSKAIRFHHDASLQLYLSLDLHLPLVRFGVSGSDDHVEKLPWTSAGGENLAVGSVIWNSIAAFSGTNHRSSVLNDFGGRGNALHGLIEILIERISGIRRHDNIERTADRAHGVLSGDGACCGMFLQEIPGESRRDLLFTIQRDIQRKIDTRHTCNLANIIVNRISFCYSPGRFWVSDACSVVEFHYGVDAGQARRHHFGSTAETGEKVGFNETRRDFEIALHPFAVQCNPDTSMCISHVYQRCSITRI